jgi:hypothetical protein
LWNVAASGESVPAPDSEPATDPNEPRRRWRSWLPRRLVKPLRRGVLLLILALVIEYLVVPELVDASKDLYLLGRINAGWVAAGTILEALSLFCYAVLTKVLLPPGLHTVVVSSVKLGPAATPPPGCHRPASSNHANCAKITRTPGRSSPGQNDALQVREAGVRQVNGDETLT